MKTFGVSTSIRATPEAIWAILTDAQSYPTWNTTVNKVEGRIAPGEKITVHAKISPGRAFPVRVAEFVPGKRMVWSGGMPLGLFRGERTFTLTTQGDGKVEFSMREVFSGLLAPLIEKSIPKPAAGVRRVRRRAEAPRRGHYVVQRQSKGRRRCPIKTPKGRARGRSPGF
jgi:hypothetical protein